jgi:hypothetical protein
MIPRGLLFFRTVCRSAVIQRPGRVDPHLRGNDGRVVGSSQGTSEARARQRRECLDRKNLGPREPKIERYPIGFRPARMRSRWGSRKGGSTTDSPRVAASSSTAKPGPSVAISKRMPLGSRK